MSIRIKLILTYVVMVAISVVLITGAGMTFMVKVFANMAETVSDIGPIEEIASTVIDVLSDIKQVETYNPEKIGDPVFAKSINDRVEKFSGFLVTEIEGQFNSFGDVALTDQFYADLEMITTDSDYTDHGTKEPNNLIKLDKQTYLVYKHEFYPSDTQVNYYLALEVTHANTTIFKNIGGGFILVLLIIMTIIILPVVLITTKDIIQPLKTLEKGANHIKEGNLDFSLKSTNFNEIGRVIRAFEKMRVELKKSIEAQIQAENNRKELVSNISHDLKTPITSIKGYVEGIRDGVAQSPEKLAKYLDVIYNKSEDMDRLIDDLFLFSKLDLHKMPFNLDGVKIVPFFESCLEELHLEFDKKDLVISSSCAVKPEFTLTMDAQKIKRVIMNIVNNAIKFMDKETKLLNINFEETEVGLTVRITDNGIGIDAADVTRIFERFYRSDASRNTSQGGSGLGLAIAKQIIEQHRGEICATSKKDQWTTIQFSLPRGANQ